LKDQLRRNQEFNKSRANFQLQRDKLLRALSKQGLRALDQIVDPHTPSGGDDARTVCLKHGIILNDLLPHKSRAATEEEMRQHSRSNIDVDCKLACVNCKQKTVGLSFGSSVYVCESCAAVNGVVSHSLAYAGNKTHEEGQLDARGEVVWEHAGEEDLPATSVQEARAHQSKISQDAHHGVQKDLQETQRTLERHALTQAIHMSDPLTLELAPINKHAKSLLDNETIRISQIGEANYKALLKLVDADLRRLWTHQEKCIDDKCKMRIVDLAPGTLKIVVEVIILDWLEICYLAVQKRDAHLRKRSDMTTANSLSQLLPTERERHFLRNSNLVMDQYSLQAFSIKAMIKAFLLCVYGEDNISLINRKYKGPIMTVLMKLREDNVPSCCSNEVTHDLLLCCKEELSNAPVEALKEALSIVENMKSRSEKHSALLKERYDKMYESYKTMNQCIEKLTSMGKSLDKVPSMMREARLMQERAQSLQTQLSSSDSEVKLRQERYNLINLVLWDKGASSMESLVKNQQLRAEQVQENLFVIAETAEAMNGSRFDEFGMLKAPEMELWPSPIGSTHGPASPPTEPSMVVEHAIQHTQHVAGQDEQSIHVCDQTACATMTNTTNTVNAMNAINTMSMSPMRRELHKVDVPHSHNVHNDACKQLMPPPPPMQPRRTISTTPVPILKGSPLKRSRPTADVQEQPLTQGRLERQTELQFGLQASLVKVQHTALQAMNATRTAQPPDFVHYREPLADASSVGSSERIPPSCPMVRVASTSSVASSCESYSTALSNTSASIRSAPALVLPSSDLKPMIVKKLSSMAARVNTELTKLVNLSNVNKNYKLYASFRNSSEAQAIFYALHLMEQGGGKIYNNTYCAAYIFFGIVYAYRHGVLHAKNDDEQASVQQSPSKRCKSNEGLAIVMSYEEAYKLALSWKNALDKLSFFSRNLYSQFDTAARRCQLLVTEA